MTDSMRDRIAGLIRGCPSKNALTVADAVISGLPWLNPDCRQGKHRACRGDAWDDDRDEPTTCGCDCHD